jgi:hypothetical protein
MIVQDSGTGSNTNATVANDTCTGWISCIIESAATSPSQGPNRADFCAHTNGAVLILGFRSLLGKDLRHRHCLMLPRYVSSILFLSLRSFSLRNVYRSNDVLSNRAAIIDLVTMFRYCYMVRGI